MAGYSGTPLPQKLGIKPGARVGVLRPPDDFATTLGALPPDVSLQTLTKAGGGAPASFDVLVCFVRALKDLGRDLPGLQARLQPAGGLWIAWPKKTAAKASKISTDVTENDVRARGLATGLVDNKVCAIDDVWSGLRFVVRLADRPKQIRRS